MAYLTSSQEPVLPTTQSVLFNWSNHSQGGFEEENTHSSLYVVSQIPHWSRLLTLLQTVPETKNLITASSVEAQPLEQLYVFRKPMETRNFLEMNPFLAPLLEEAYTNIRKYFPYSEIFLEVVSDPETVDEEQLVVFIAVDQNPDEASQALSRFDEDWWLVAMEQAQDKLCVTLEFR